MNTQNNELATLKAYFNDAHDMSTTDELLDNLMETFSIYSHRERMRMHAQHEQHAEELETLAHAGDDLYAAKAKNHRAACNAIRYLTVHATMNVDSFEHAAMSARVEHAFASRLVFPMIRKHLSTRASIVRRSIRGTSVETFTLHDVCEAIFPASAAFVRTHVEGEWEYVLNTVVNDSRFRSTKVTRRGLKVTRWYIASDLETARDAAERIAKS